MYFRIFDIQRTDGVSTRVFVGFRLAQRTLKWVLTGFNDFGNWKHAFAFCKHHPKDRSSGVSLHHVDVHNGVQFCTNLSHTCIGSQHRCMLQHRSALNRFDVSTPCSSAPGFFIRGPVETDQAIAALSVRAWALHCILLRIEEVTGRGLMIVEAMI